MNENLPLYDFDGEFQKFALSYANAKGLRTDRDMDKLEELLPKLYLRFINKPSEALDGLAPALYFNQFADPWVLLDWMCDYELAGIPTPDLLTERIKKLSSDDNEEEDEGKKNGAEDALMEYLERPKTPYVARLTIVSMLIDLKSIRPLSVYIDWIKGRQGKRDDLVDMAADALIEMGDCVTEPVLAAMEKANSDGQATFLDILCNFYERSDAHGKTIRDTRILRWAINLFLAHSEETALFASYLGKLGDPSAIPVLLDAIRTRSLNYLDFIEARNAVEALGGDAPEEPSWDGDPFYESLKSIRM
ncbi:MAG: hypothetical protein LBD16_04115 [Oscillospiraceae bacterium]|jgi:hypothetical protein|nr:hypothetical protein [Oscillospiraceae bacterium]